MSSQGNIQLENLINDPIQFQVKEMRPNTLIDKEFTICSPEEGRDDVDVEFSFNEDTKSLLKSKSNENKKIINITIPFQQNHLFYKQFLTDNELIPLTKQYDDDEQYDGDDNNNFKNGDYNNVIQILSISLRDSWRIAKWKISQLNLKKSMFHKKMNELIGKRHLYKHILANEYTKNANKNIEIRTCEKQCLSFKEQLLKINQKICQVKNNLAHETWEIKILCIENSKLKIELDNLQSENKKIIDDLTKERNSSDTLNNILIDQVLLAWVLSTCIKDELKSQISTGEILVSELESRNVQLTLDTAVQSQSLIAYQNMFQILRPVLNELNGKNLKFEESNLEYKNKLNKNHDEENKLQNNYEQIVDTLKIEEEKTIYLQDTLNKLRLEGKEDMEELIKYKQLNVKKSQGRGGHVFKRINIMNIVKFLLGYDQHLI